MAVGKWSRSEVEKNLSGLGWNVKRLQLPL
jgi:hypothetical protein